MVVLQEQGLLLVHGLGLGTGVQKDYSQEYGISFVVPDFGYQYIPHFQACTNTQVCL